MRRNWPTRRWIVKADGEMWRDPEDPPGLNSVPLDDPRPPGSLPGSAISDELDDGAQSTSDLTDEGFTIAALLCSGRTHEQIGAQFARSAKWTQRKLRATPAIEEAADELRGQLLASVAGRAVTGLNTPIEILQGKAGNPGHPEQLAASRLLLSESLKFHSQRLMERGYRQRLDQLEQELATLREAVLPGEASDEL